MYLPQRSEKRLGELLLTSPFSTELLSEGGSP